MEYKTIRNHRLTLEQRVDRLERDIVKNRASLRSKRFNESRIDLDSDEVDDIEFGTRKPSKRILDQLFDDIYNGNLQGVKDYISMDYDLNVKNKYGNTPLMYAQDLYGKQIRNNKNKNIIDLLKNPYNLHYFVNDKETTVDEFKNAIEDTLKSFVLNFDSISFEFDQKQYIFNTSDISRNNPSFKIDGENLNSLIDDFLSKHYKEYGFDTKISNSKNVKAEENEFIIYAYNWNDNGIKYINCLAKTDKEIKDLNLKKRKQRVYRSLNVGVGTSLMNIKFENLYVIFKEILYNDSEIFYQFTMKEKDISMIEIIDKLICHSSFDFYDSNILCISSEPIVTPSTEDKVSFDRIKTLPKECIPTKNVKNAPDYILGYCFAKTGRELKFTTRQLGFAINSSDGNWVFNPNCFATYGLN